MSYDVTFGPAIAEPSRNYTSNVAPMWFEALGESLGDLIVRVPRAGELLPHIERGIAAMKADPDKYRAMDPANGWGNFEGALDYLEWIAENCRDFPDITVDVSR